MGALFLRDLADKTRRGLVGRVLAGRVVGRVPYGYDRVTGRLDKDGEVERGLVQPNPAEAAVVAGSSGTTRRASAPARSPRR
jgi:hypothetical protein